MAMRLTVEDDKIAAMKAALPATGCKLLRVRPRAGKDSDGVSIRNVEIKLPALWQGSMSTALYDLPGVRLMSGTIGRQRAPYRWFTALGWYVRPSRSL